MSNDSALFAKPSRIDIIGQNGNDGDHYDELPSLYAIQTEFSYGWDYLETSEDGLRTVYTTKEEADNTLKTIHCDSSLEWRVVQYDPTKDDSFARK